MEDRSRASDSFNLLIVVIGVCKVSEGAKRVRAKSFPSAGAAPGGGGLPPAAPQPFGASGTCRHRKQPLMLWSLLVSNS